MISRSKRESREFNRGLGPSRLVWRPSRAHRAEGAVSRGCASLHPGLRSVSPFGAKNDAKTGLFFVPFGAAPLRWSTEDQIDPLHPHLCELCITSVHLSPSIEGKGNPNKRPHLRQQQPGARVFFTVGAEVSLALRVVSGKSTFGKQMSIFQTRPCTQELATQFTSSLSS